MTDRHPATGRFLAYDAGYQDGYANGLKAGAPVSPPDDDAADVVRAAAGVVRTAHPEVTKYGVVAEWWNALVAALDRHQASGGEGS